jgi:uncharacterized protein DUF4157
VAADTREAASSRRVETGEGPPRGGYSLASVPIHTGGRSLEAGVRTAMEGALGVGLGDVRVHTGAEAAASARDVEAKAYTVGRDVSFSAGRYAPETSEGRRLLAHELVHSLQQAGGTGPAREGSEEPALEEQADAVAGQVAAHGRAKPFMPLQAAGLHVARQPEDPKGKPKGGKKAGKKDAPKAEKKEEAPQEEGNKPKGTVTMKFDGRDLIVFDDDVEVFRFSGQSGRPIRLRPEDAKKANADPVTDTYMNDKRFVGVKDFGPIPEGRYTFAPRGIQRFDVAERTELLFSEHETTVQTAAGPVGGGDWGQGRVALTPSGPLVEGPFGSTNTRSGFFLHGGIMGGSSGCIDIGGDFASLADWLAGYRRAVPLTVKYEHAGQNVGVFTGFTGMIAYRAPKFGFGMSGGLGFEYTGGVPSFLLSASIGPTLEWAGGGMFVGVRLDGSMNERDKFVRLGVDGGFDFRLYKGLFGQISGGYMGSFDEAVGFGPMAGTGLKYDFGPVNLGLMYDHLFSLAKPDPNTGLPDPHADQLFLRLGLIVP